MISKSRFNVGTGSHFGAETHMMGLSSFIPGYSVLFFVGEPASSTGAI